MRSTSGKFLVQVQSERLLLLEESDIIKVGERLTHAWSEDCEMTTGDDNGRYVNIRIHSSEPRDTWAKINDLFLGSDFLSTEIRVSSIVTMAGDDGWDDYLLLHHFDPDEKLDRFA